MSTPRIAAVAALRVLRGRILTAVTAGLAMGCPSSPPVAANVEPVDGAAPPASATTSQPVEPVAEAPHEAARCDGDGTVDESCYAPFTGPPSNVPPQLRPRETFDKNGCFALRPDACEGIRSVISGPHIKSGRCCFTVCRGQVAPCGRPLLDARAEARVAASTERRDWHDPVTVRPSPIAGRLRIEWLEDAAAEHASIAAFARFTMELLAVGAPSELVLRAHRAGADEIAHARACYALASAYGGAAGPDRLPLDGIAPRETLADVAAATAIEACVGETFAALCASEALAECTDSAVRAVLAAIARDEAEHAALGWQVVAWAAMSPGVRGAVERAFERAFDRGPVARREDIEGLRAAGRLTNEDRARLWRVTRDEIVIPAWHRLWHAEADDAVVDRAQPTA